MATTDSRAAALQASSIATSRLYAVLPAADPQRAKAWYAEKLGVAPKSEEAWGGLWYEFQDGTRLMVTPSQFAGTAQNTAAGWMVSGIEAVMAELQARGVTFEEYDLPGLKTEQGLVTLGPLEGTTYKGAWFKDSEGNILGLGEAVRG